MTTGNTYKASDGDSVTLQTSAAVVARQVAVISGWAGIAAGNADSGDYVALSLEGEYEVVVPAGLTLNVGDVLRIDTTHVTGHTPDDDTSAYNTSAASSTNLTLGRVTKAKDANNVVTLILMIGGI